MSEEKDGWQIIDEVEVEFMLDLLQNIQPPHGYKEKHRRAVRMMNTKLGQILWQRREDEAREFLTEWRTERLKTTPEVGCNHDIQ